MHAASRETNRESFGIGVAPRFDRRIIVLREIPGNGVHVDDPPLAAPSHRATGRIREVKHGLDHDLDTRVMKREVVTENVAAHTEARVIDEDVNGGVFDVFLCKTRCDAVPFSFHFEVAHHFFDIDAVAGAEVLSETREAIGIASNQHEVDTPLSEFARESGPDTRGAAGDEGPMHGPYDTLGPRAHERAPILSPVLDREDLSACLCPLPAQILSIAKFFLPGPQAF